MKNLERTRKLVKTIDSTIDHLQGTKKMKDAEIFAGFSKEKQAEYEKQLVDRFGDKAKVAIAESHQNVKNWTKADWDRSKAEFDDICKKLTLLLEKRCKIESSEVQTIIRKHHEWLRKFWTPTKESYTTHGQFIVESELRKAYEACHPELPKFISKAIQVFAERELQ